MRERAGVDANAQSVTPGHPAVREIAESGEPIEVQPAPQYTAAPAQRRSGGRPYRPSSSSGGSGGRPTAARPTGAPTRRPAPRRAS
jgi:hypothetical protein